MWLTVRVFGRMVNMSYSKYLLLYMCRTPTTKRKNWLLNTISQRKHELPQTAYLLTVKTFFFLSNIVSQCGLLFPDKLWIYVVLCFILWFYLSFFGVSVRMAGLRVQAAVTQQTLICFYGGSLKKGFITVIDSTSVFFFFSFCGR